MTMSFLHLPGEIRNSIYRLLLVFPEPVDVCDCTLPEAPDLQPNRHGFHITKCADGTIPVDGWKTRCRPDDIRFPRVSNKADASPRGLGILATNRTIHDEATFFLYSCNRFLFSLMINWWGYELTALSAFVDYMPLAYLAMIQHICIPFPRIQLADHAWREILTCTYQSAACTYISAWESCSRANRAEMFQLIGSMPNITTIETLKGTFFTDRPWMIRWEQRWDEDEDAALDCAVKASSVADAYFRSMPLLNKVTVNIGEPTCRTQDFADRVHEQVAAARGWELRVDSVMNPTSQ